MTDQDLMDRDQAEQHRDELELQRQILEALKASRMRPLTDDESMLLAWRSGLSTEFYREIRL
jgi:hypothetical protein